MNVEMRDLPVGRNASEFRAASGRAAAFLRRISLAGTGANHRLRPLFPAASSLRRAAAAVLVASLIAVGIAVASGWDELARRSKALWPSLPQGTIVAPSPGKNFGWIARAIRECEAEAARNADTLYFIVMPVVAADGNSQQWVDKSNGTVGNSVLLMGAETTLDGLKNGLLTLYQDRFNFAIGEASTRRAYRWKPAMGVTKFAVRGADSIQAFKPGFQTAGAAKTEWADGSAITREAGTCYWTGALVRS
jgi:hypothetical protein